MHERGAVARPHTAASLAGQSTPSVHRSIRCSRIFWRVFCLSALRCAVLCVAHLCARASRDCSHTSTAALRSQVPRTRASLLERPPRRPHRTRRCTVGTLCAVSGACKQQLLENVTFTRCVLPPQPCALRAALHDKHSVRRARRIACSQGHVKLSLHCRPWRAIATPNSPRQLLPRALHKVPHIAKVLLHTCIPRAQSPHLLLLLLL